MEPTKPKQNPKAIGERSEAHIIAKLSEAGYYVLKPFGDNLRYDLVIEDADGRFWRYSVRQGDQMANISNLHLQAFTIIHAREELLMEVRITRTRLITSPCTVPKTKKHT